MSEKTLSQKANLNCTTKDPAYNVACYYGALVAPKIKFEKNHLSIIKSMKTMEGDDKFSPAEDAMAALIAYHEGGIADLPQGSMLWSEGSYNTGKNLHRGKRLVRLDIIGTTKSIAEAILIQTSIAIIKEEGFKELIVDINSIGNKDALGKFQREVNAFYRKNLDEVSPNCKPILKNDPLSAHTCSIEEEDEIAFKAPQSISFLAEDHRHHFQEVLEFLESLNIDYRINNGLVGHRGYSTDTVFTISLIDAKGGEIVIAAGSRYNSLSKKMGYKKEVPGAGITLYLPSLAKTARPPKPMKKSKFFFIQIGFEAKLKSLQIIEILRKAKIPLYQSLSRDKLSAQLSIAETEKYPYVLIMGQKEALEDSVLVRDIESRSQETVSISELPAYLRNIA